MSFVVSLSAEVYITSDKVMSLTAAYTVLLDQILAGEGIQPHVYMFNSTDQDCQDMGRNLSICIQDSAVPHS